jgi:hypothetical protein
VETSVTDIGNRRPPNGKAAKAAFVLGSIFRQSLAHLWRGSPWNRDVAVESRCRRGIAISTMRHGPPRAPIPTGPPSPRAHAHGPPRASSPQAPSPRGSSPRHARHGGATTSRSLMPTGPTGRATWWGHHSTGRHRCWGKRANRIPLIPVRKQGGWAFHPGLQSPERRGNQLRIRPASMRDTGPSRLEAGSCGGWLAGGVSERLSERGEAMGRATLQGGRPRRRRWRSGCGCAPGGGRGERRPPRRRRPALPRRGGRTGGGRIGSDRGPPSALEVFQTDRSQPRSIGGPYIGSFAPPGETGMRQRAHVSGRRGRPLDA